MPLIQTLPDGPLDIVGDMHGEIEHLLALVKQLGYAQDGSHPEGRRLVFVGDYCDRGPDSPAVFQQVQQWVEAGQAFGILGNHEINLIRADIKDGSGWFFEARVERDTANYSPFQRATPEQQSTILQFARTLPLVLERDDLRIVHAAWDPPSIAALRALDNATDIATQYDQWEDLAHQKARQTGLDLRMQQEQADWGHDLEDPQYAPPMLPAHAEHESDKQTMNPLKVLTSGLERPCQRPFYAGGRWRFVERLAWWNEYTEAIPVVIGHYWRRLRPQTSRSHFDIFGGVGPEAWLGPQQNVFCVDFSVGGRWIERRKGLTTDPEFKLAALRWPEAELVFDDGTRIATQLGQIASPAL